VGVQPSECVSAVEGKTITGKSVPGPYEAQERKGDFQTKNAQKEEGMLARGGGKGEAQHQFYWRNVTRGHKKTAVRSARTLEAGFKLRRQGKTRGGNKNGRGEETGQD